MKIIEEEIFYTAQEAAEQLEVDNLDFKKLCNLEFIESAFIDDDGKYYSKWSLDNFKTNLLNPIQQIFSSRRTKSKSKSKKKPEETGKLNVDFPRMVVPEPEPVACSVCGYLFPVTFILRNDPNKYCWEHYPRKSFN